MSEAKSKFKVDFSHSFGCDIEDLMDAKQTGIHQITGGIHALAEIAKFIADLGAHVDKDMEEGKFKDLSEVQVSGLVKRYLGRAVGVVDNLKQKATRELEVTRGEVQAYSKVISKLKKIHDEESSKLEHLKKVESISQSSIESSPGDIVVSTDTATISEVSSSTRRISGTHPGPSLAARRKAAEAEAKSQVEVEYPKEKKPRKPRKKKTERTNECLSL